MEYFEKENEFKRINESEISLGKCLTLQNSYSKCDRSNRIDLSQEVDLQQKKINCKDIYIYRKKEAFTKPV